MGTEIHYKIMFNVYMLDISMMKIYIYIYVIYIYIYVNFSHNKTEPTLHISML